MPFVQGFLRIRGGSEGRPDNELPGAEGPVDPGYGISIDRPDNSLPDPPGIWPPPNLGNPIVPIHPDNSLPVQPGTIWPSPGRPNRPDQGLPGYGRPDNSLPGSQPGVDNTLPGSQPGIDNTLPGGQGGEITNPIQPKTYWMLCYCPTLGWKYVAVDPSLRPGNALPPHAQPK